MKIISPRTLACIAVLLGSLSLSACSTLAAVNPFKQQMDTEGSESAPANESMPLSTPATSIRVETKPPEPKGQQEVEVNVGNNVQCTTFCSLPMRQRPVN